MKNYALSKRFAGVSLMIHGTSSSFLDKIMDNGIVPNPEQRVWKKDSIETQDQKQTLPDASYWTNNFMTAYTASGNAYREFGGNRILVYARINTGDKRVSLDEDHFPNVGRFVGKDLNRVLNKYLLATLRKPYDRNSAIDLIIKDLKQKVPHIPLERFEKEREILKELVDAWVEFEVLREAYTSFDFHGKERVGFRSHDDERITATKEEVEQARNQYRDVLLKVLKKLNFIATKKDFIHNIRFEGTIGHGGFQKVVLIAEFMKSQDNSVEKVNILLNKDQTALQDLVESVHGRIGPGVQIFYKGKSIDQLEH